MNRLLRKNYKLIIFYFLSSLPIYFLIKDIIYKTNDIVGDTSTLIYIKESLVNFRILPLWNPFYNQGLPVVADPLSNFLNPFILFPVLLFPFNIAINIILFFSIFFAGLNYYIFSKNLNISKINSIFFSLIYITSGYFLSRVVAGHFELIVSYCLIPIFYLFLIKLVYTFNIKWVYALSLTIAIFLFSGATYLYYYSFILLGASILHLLISFFLHKKREYLFKISSLFLVGFTTVLYSSVKLLPVLQSNSYFTKEIMPFLGSENLFQIFGSLFIPLNSHSVFNAFIPPSIYPWWESYSFIGPAALLGIILFCYSFSKNKYPFKMYLLYLVGVGVLFLTLDNTWNPLYWIVKNIVILQKFRIPSRFFAFIIPILLILSGMGFDYMQTKFKNAKLKNFLYIFAILSIILNYYFFFFAYNSKHFEDININYNKLISYLERNDPQNNFYVAQNVLFQNQLPQFNLIENRIKILNSNYGFSLKNSATKDYINLDFNRLKRNNYNKINPKYFIYPCSITPPSVFNTSVLVKNKDSCLYENNVFTPFAFITSEQAITFEKNNSNNVDVKTTIEPNVIIVEAYAENYKSVLNVMESYYPGWEASVKGEKINILKGDYIKVNMLKGDNTYLFKFNSFTFRLGLFITLASLLLSAISLKLINDKNTFRI